MSNLATRCLAAVMFACLPIVSLPAQEVVTVAASTASADAPRLVLEIPPEEVPFAPEVNNFIKGMALILLPKEYSDEDDWNLHKRVQSGLNVKLDGLKLDTSRRWKDVRHGTWQRLNATLIDPENHFQLAISLLPQSESGDPRYRVRAAMRLRATGQQQRWNFGVQLYSISADVIADVAFDADIQFRNQIVESDDGRKLRVLPHVETAKARIQSLSLRNVSHAKGGAVREFGNVVESMAKRVVKKKNQKLAAKINGKILKKPERFEVPAGILAIIGGAPKATVE